MPLWTSHITDRLATRSSQFAGESWIEYLLFPIVQTLPWTALVLVGAWQSAKTAKYQSESLDRLLWAWFLVPSLLVSMASARNSHYLIHGLPPLSIWAAMSLDRWGQRLQSRGWNLRQITRGATLLFVTIGAGWGIAFTLIGPKLNVRDAELAFYERVGQTIDASTPLILLYDLERAERWDKDPYPTPFGPIPSDLAARLFSLNRPTAWRSGIKGLRSDLPQRTFHIIARERDFEDLSKIGRVEIIDRGPLTRWDRVFVLYRIRTQAIDAGTGAW
jgi:hypothetical protein